MAQSKAYDSNAGEWPKYTGFKALRSASLEVRLLLLKPKAGSSSLRFVMRHVELGETPNYGAVSYCWGAPVPHKLLRGIFIDGQCVKIRPTLYAFLKTMTLHNPTKCLWIDAICINQDDVEERNQQISIMGTIYKTAQEVYVWLGIGDDDTNYAIDHIGDTKPDTHFDQQVFSECVPKLFRASYWTRRWVIQEFALARQVVIVCGPRLANWRNLVKKTDAELPATDAQAVQILQKFQKDSVADVFFRVLSILPTESVWPRTSGYRWPHETATRVLSCLPLTRQDVLRSLVPRASDRFFAVFEYIGRVTKVRRLPTESQGSGAGDGFSSFNFEVVLSIIDRNYLGDKPQYAEHEKSARGTGGLMPGDLVYSLQSTAKSPQGFYIGFRPDGDHQIVLGMVIEKPDTVAVRYWASIGLAAETIECIWALISSGISKCSRNLSSSWNSRLLCHIDRPTLILLWLLDNQRANSLLHNRQQCRREFHGGNSLCDCFERATQSQVPVSPVQSEDNLEILSSLHFIYGGFMGEVNTLPWSDGDQKLSQKVLKVKKSPWEDHGHIDFRNHGRTALMNAAKDGLINFTRNILSRDGDVNAVDDAKRDALWWAVWKGNEEVIDVLLKTATNCNRALCVACAKGYENIVQQMLKRGANVSTKDTTFGNPLQAASRNGHKKLVQMLLNESMNVDEDFGTALRDAALRGHEKVLHLLISKLRNARKPTYETINGSEWQESPLWAASIGGYETMVLMLLENGANVKAHGNCALKAASEGGHEKIAQMLVDRGADANDLTLYPAAVAGRDKVVQLLLKHGADVNATGKDECRQRTALHTASERGHEKVVQILLDNGADADEGALLIAARNGHEKVAQMLLDKGADANSADGGYTALCPASAEGHEKIVQILLDKGANINEWAFCLASRNGHEKVVQMLLDNGADVNAIDWKMQTALFQASLEGHEKVVQILLENGADINVNLNDQSALEAASFYGYEKVVGILLMKFVEKRAKLRSALWEASEESKDEVLQMLREGDDFVQAMIDRALRAASLGGHKEVVRMLLEKGASVNALGFQYNDRGKADANIKEGRLVRTALYEASKKGHLGVVRLLLEKGADVNTDCGRHGTALAAAKHGTNGQVIQLLLEYGAE